MTKAPGSLQELRRRIYRKTVPLASTARVSGTLRPRDGLEFLAAVREDLVTGRYQPMPNRPVEIPKGKGKSKTIPCVLESGSLHNESSPQFGSEVLT
jgi:RNA-directed DNA polymerase